MVLVTDIGHDPDDVIALSYLIEHGIIPSIIYVSPGFDDQVRIANGIISSYKIESEVVKCINKTNANYNCGKHNTLLGKLSYSEISKTEVDCSLIIGPAINMGEFLKSKTIYFQGGYSPNSINPLDKFSGLEYVQSYNPCGAKSDFNKLVESSSEKYFIGKNVCHGFLKESVKWSPSNKLILDFYNRLNCTKAMHDLLAAACFMNKSIGVWERSKPIWSGSKMSTIPCLEESYSLIGLSDSFYI